ncbi:hypothetical protein CSUI_007663, partial [Cystoisospora suis]
LPSGTRFLRVHLAHPAVLKHQKKRKEKVKENEEAEGGGDVKITNSFQEREEKGHPQSVKCLSSSSSAITPTAAALPTVDGRAATLDSSSSSSFSSSSLCGMNGDVRYASEERKAFCLPGERDHLSSLGEVQFGRGEKEEMKEENLGLRERDLGEKKHNEGKEEERTMVDSFPRTQHTRRRKRTEGSESDQEEEREEEEKGGEKKKDEVKDPIKNRSSSTSLQATWVGKSSPSTPPSRLYYRLATALGKHLHPVSLLAALKCPGSSSCSSSITIDKLRRCLSDLEELLQRECGNGTSFACYTPLSLQHRVYSHSYLQKKRVKCPSCTYTPTKEEIETEEEEVEMFMELASLEKGKKDDTSFLFSSSSLLNEKERERREDAKERMKLSRIPNWDRVWSVLTEEKEKKVKVRDRKNPKEKKKKKKEKRDKKDEEEEEEEFLKISSLRNDGLEFCVHTDLSSSSSSSSSFTSSSSSEEEESFDMQKREKEEKGEAWSDGDNKESRDCSFHPPFPRLKREYEEAVLFAFREGGSHEDIPDGEQKKEKYVEAKRKNDNEEEEEHEKIRDRERQKKKGRRRREIEKRDECLEEVLQFLGAVAVDVNEGSKRKRKGGEEQEKEEESELGISMDGDASSSIEMSPISVLTIEGGLIHSHAIYAVLQYLAERFLKDSENPEKEKTVGGESSSSSSSFSSSSSSSSSTPSSQDQEEVVGKPRSSVGCDRRGLATASLGEKEEKKRKKKKKEEKEEGEEEEEERVPWFAISVFGAPDAPTLFSGNAHGGGDLSGDSTCHFVAFSPSSSFARENESRSAKSLIIRTISPIDSTSTCP